MNPILILSGTGDAHAKHMCSVLEAKRMPYFLFPTEQYPFHSTITLDGNRNYSLEFEGRTVLLDEHWSIWNRRIFPTIFPVEFPTELEEMVKTEIKTTLHGFLETHKGFVVNRPSSNTNAGNKSEQLLRARKLGFRTPDSIITNSPSHAQNFYTKHNGDIIFKMQKLPIVRFGEQDYRTIMTRRVSVEDLGDLERIRNCPCLFQERIEKDYEIRLTVIGEKLFPIAIYSQDSEYSLDDFRRYDFEKVKYELVDIPPNLRTKVLRLAREYKLEYAAIDLIYTPTKEYVFLEINPNGQYLWTEEMSHVPITEYFAEYLAGVSHE